MVDLVKIRKKKAAKQSEPPAPQPEAKPQPAAPEPAQHSELRTQHSTDKLARFKAEAGTRREGFIRDVAETARAAAEVEVLTFALAGEQYAVDIQHILEIVTPRPTTRVPNAHAGVVGIISLRGLIVTVLDVRAKLHHPSAAGAAERRIIVVERGGETLGFEVDRVLRVLKLDAAAIEPHPVVHSSEQTDAIRGVFRHAGALTILLDLDKLLA